ncbi:SPOR domain-containing protein [Pedobacter yulinensis]|uniref:SPOR domain-containing protein n=1 Tax=Pedobacter yulinensis TaxID=2126353 RepID=A0A2T3HQQ8_9SPHI|nr:SPOR domain-containing protein [Pedobacter yulinensis]PST84731.1 SPOR domain-containing protein [Pedobacter yulinensis]
MRKTASVFLLILLSCAAFGQSGRNTPGTVRVVKDPLIDSLIAKRAALYRKKTTVSPKAPVAPVVSSMGYRVQVFYGSDRRQTFNMQARFRQDFPNYRTYITYREPNYYLRVGDFRSRLEAQRFLNQLRPKYPTLFIFREKINAPNLESDDQGEN